MKTFVRKGVPIGCVLPCPCSHLLSSRSPLPPPLTPPLLPEDHWLTVHPPARSPRVWPQPGACQLVPLPRLALASIPGRCCSLFSLLLPAGPAHPHSPHCALCHRTCWPSVPGEEDPHPSRVDSCHRGGLSCHCVWGFTVPATFQSPRSCLAPQWPCAPQLWLHALLVLTSTLVTGTCPLLTKLDSCYLYAAGHYGQQHA